MRSADGPPTSAHVVASITDPGAGTSYSVPALAKALGAAGARTEVHTVRGWREGGAVQPDLPPVEAHTQSFARIPLLGAACLSGELRRALMGAAQNTDILHSHGAWLMINVYPAWAARQGRAKLVTSPRGMLGAEAIAFSKQKKAVFWRLFQARALRQAACLHATSESERGDIRAAGLTNPVAVISNGVDLPALAAAGPGGPRTVLSLGRIHPKKGLDTLVRAWAKVEANHADWRLRIIGPAELDHDRELVALSASLGLGRVSIEGPAFGANRLAAYHAADLFVLPTRHENFANTVAEALAAGVPVISTRGAPWSGLEREDCGWWIDHGPEPLATTLHTALGLSREVLVDMGVRGRAWMARDFSWARVADEMLDVYGWVARGGEPPSTVRLD